MLVLLLSSLRWQIKHITRKIIENMKEIVIALPQEENFNPPEGIYAAK